MRVQGPTNWSALQSTKPSHDGPSDALVPAHEPSPPLPASTTTATGADSTSLTTSRRYRFANTNNPNEEAARERRVPLAYGVRESGPAGDASDLDRRGAAAAAPVSTTGTRCVVFSFSRLSPPAARSGCARGRSSWCRAAPGEEGADQAFCAESCST
ncbi:hypothetical protein CDD83_2590 [Cordyceps sp. RAO-2017]|nr:hypothetical protein CDD83_2590 [Cordyceps sp. RAO-2017]